MCTAELLSKFLVLVVVCSSTCCASAAFQFASSSAFARESRLLIAEDAPAGPTFSGNASWYGVPFNGKKTASGELFDMNKLSAAHLHLPMVTKVLVENPRTGDSIVVRVNDRGPFHTKRVMDLSREAAKRVGIFPHGVGYIECTVLTGKDAGKSKVFSSKD